MLGCKNNTRMATKTQEELLEARAKKDARRAKQRAANVGRAQKMHKARLAWEAERGMTETPDRNAVGPLHIGCSGWFYWDWRGKFYPQEGPTSEWFGLYADRFQTVELNAPFYSWPTVATVQTWLRQTEGGPFIYTVKVSELITHVLRFEGTEELVRDFGWIADLLGPRMGCFLYQLPPSFHFTTERLEAIVSQLDPKRRNVVEFRHISWWNEGVYAAFRKAGIIFCSCSAPKLPDALVKTADEIYVRFHGTDKWYRHDYGLEELEIWADKIRQSGATTIWVYFNNDYDGYAIKNADELTMLLNAR